MPQRKVPASPGNVPEDSSLIKPFLSLSEYRFLKTDDAQHIELHNAFRERFGFVLPTAEVIDRLVDACEPWRYVCAA